MELLKEVWNFLFIAPWSNGLQEFFSLTILLVFVGGLIALFFITKKLKSLESDIKNSYKNESYYTPINFVKLKMQKIDNYENILNNLPNTLVSIGIIATFIGIGIVMKEAGEVINSAHSGSIDLNGLKNLITIIGFKFQTSVWGIFFSLIFMLVVLQPYKNHKDGKINDLIKELSNEYENPETKKILTAVESFQEVFVANSDKQYKWFSEEYISNLERIMDTNTQKISDNTVSAIKETNNEIKEAILKNTDNTVSAIKETNNEIKVNSENTKNIVGQLSVLNDKFSSIDKMVSALKEASGSIQDSANNLNDSINRLMEDMKNTIKDATNKMNETTKQGAESLAKASNEINNSLETINSSLAKNLNDIKKELGNNLTNMATNLNESLQKLQDESSKMTANLSNTMADLKQSMQSSLSMLDNNIKSTLQNLSSDINKGVDNLNSTTNSTLNNMEKTIGKILTESNESLKTANQYFNRIGAVLELINNVLSDLHSDSERMMELAEKLAGEVAKKELEKTNELFEESEENVDVEELEKLNN